MALNHSRNVSTSSDETLVCSPTGPPTSTPPAASQVDQDLRDAAERIVRQKQAAEIRRLRQVAGELTREKDDEIQRAEALKIDLAVSEANRQASLDMAIQYYKKQGNPFLVDLEALSERVEEMRREISSRDNVILDRDAVIEALGREVDLYAGRDHWIVMEQRYYDLQQRYGQMPADLRSLERRYGNLEDNYVDLYRICRNREADVTVLRAQLSQVQDERDQFKRDASTARQQSENAVSRYREVKANRDHILVEKAESEEQARTKKRLLADLASRSFKRTIILSCMLDDFDVETCDDELASLCQLAQEHLGIDYKELYKDFAVAKAAKRDEEAGEERDESGVAKAHTRNTASSAAAPNFDRQEPGTHHAEPSRSSATTESPNTYDARRRREVAAAEEAILGPLGLGFEDGSPTLKSMPIPEGSKSSKAPHMKKFLPASPATPIKIRRGLFAPGANEIDQVTPARTGGTGGIARDQWRIAADDLHELTEVFRGPRVQQVDIVSPEAGIQTAAGEDGSRGDGRDPAPIWFLNRNEEDLYEDDLVEETEVERDFVASNPSPKMPLAEGSRVFQDLEIGNGNVQQEVDATPNIPKEAFNAPKFENFNFGESSGAIRFTGSEDQSSAIAEGPSASPSSGIFNLASARTTQAPVNTYTPPIFGQDFNFGGSNTAVSFTASQNAPSCLPTPAPELESAAASSVLGMPLAEDSPAVTVEARNEVSNEEASDNAIEENRPAEALSAKPQNSKKAKAKAKKAEEKARKAEERKQVALQAKGPNRNQRRAASRERKAAEKKAQAEAKKAQSATTKAAERRRAVATAMTGV